MKKYLIGLMAILGIVFSGISSTWAFEIITEDDIKKEIIITAYLLKTADNAVFLFDSSSSMNKPYKDTGMTRYEVAKKMIVERNQYFPDLGHNFGFYLYTPWKEIYPVQKYNREKFAAALATLPEKATGPTLTAQGLRRLETILSSLEGKTSVFLFTDGSDVNKGGRMKKPAEIVAELAKKYNVCFYVVSTGDDYYSADIFNRAKDANFCSRAIGFEQFLTHPEFNSEALFTVVAKKEIVTVTDQKITGIKTRDALFGFDQAELSDTDKEDLGLLAAFLKSEPDTYAILAGYTDNIGDPDYNMALSRRRADQVAGYLTGQHGVDPSRVLTFWYGENNPVIDNTTAENRRLNRRVEILVKKN